MSTGKALEMLREKRRMLTRQQYRTIKGQIIAGDISGAMKGLAQIKSKQEISKSKQGASRE